MKYVEEQLALVQDGRARSENKALLSIFGNSSDELNNMRAFVACEGLQIVSAKKIVEVKYLLLLRIEECFRFSYFIGNLD